MITFFLWSPFDLITAGAEFGYLEVPIRALFALILALLLISLEAALNKHV